MQFIPYGILRKDPAQLTEVLEREGQVVLTKNGKPFALLIGIAENQLDETLLFVSRLRAQKAISTVRNSAREQGLEILSEEEIEAEVNIVRNARNTR